MDDTKLVELTKENMKLKTKVKKLEKEVEVISRQHTNTKLEFEGSNKYLKERLAERDEYIHEYAKKEEDHIRSICFLEDMVERQEAQIKDLREIARLLSKAYSSDPSDLV